MMFGIIKLSNNTNNKKKKKTYYKTNTQMEIKNIAYLNWFLIDFVWPPTEFVQGCVGILPVNHNNIGTTPWRNHLDTKGEMH